MGTVLLRRAEWADADMLFMWVNDSEVRKNSFNTTDIKYEEHKRWFEKCMLDKDIDIYICCLNADPVGYMRLNYNYETAVVSYSIAKKYRGQGFGKVIIKLIESEVAVNRPEVKFLYGSVKLENIASQKIFENNNFERELVEGENTYFSYQKKIESTNAD